MRAAFSHRFFARKAGFSSSSFCLSVIRGRFNLSVAALEKLVRAMELDTRQAAYFKALVQYNQSKKPQEREAAWVQIQELRKSVEFKSLGAPQQGYFSHWYYAVLRELACHPAWDGDFLRLARWLEPQLSTEDARKAVQDLLEWGLLIQEPNGRYRQTNALLNADGVPPVALRQIRREFLQHGVGALDALPPSLRFTAMTTLAVSKSSYEYAVQVLEEARQKIIARAADDSSVEKVYEMILQVFPLTRPIGEGQK